MGKHLMGRSGGHGGLLGSMAVAPSADTAESLQASDQPRHDMHGSLD